MEKELVCVILAGGEGKRFWPLTSDKNSFPFGNKTFFDLAFQNALPKEVSRAVIVTNKDNDEYFKRFTFSVPHQTVVQKSSHGMADAIRVAGDLIKNSRVLIALGDHAVEKNLLHTIVNNSSKAFGVISGWTTPVYFPGGYLILEGSRVIGIHEKPGEGNEPSKYVYVSGLYVGDSDMLLAAIKTSSSGSDDVFEKALSALMKDNIFIVEPYEGMSTALKYPWHTLDALRDMFLPTVKEYRGKNVIIKSNVVIEGPVFLGDNVKIFEFTKIVGPAYIGDNTIIGNNNIIRDSYIGSGCVTGFNTDITRSYIGDSCWFHSNYIGDSVLEENVSLGSGTVLANLRLDEKEICSVVKGQKVNTNRTKLGAIIGKNVRIGVNASIMPGVKIGSGSFVGAGSLVSQDVAAVMFYATKSEPLLVPNTKTIASGDRDSFKKKFHF